MQVDWGDERREYFRITDRLQLECRPITYQESLALEKSLSQDFLLEDRYGRLSKTPGSPPLIRDLYARLEAVERKLDRVMEVLLARDGAGYIRYAEVDVSASGIRFSSDIGWDEGTYLELQIGLPSIPVAKVSALGKIVRTERKSGDVNGPWQIGVSFVAMREKEKDLLVHYVFSKERERLRADRMSKGSK
jgi:hypothetical protein